MSLEERKLLVNYFWVYISATTNQYKHQIIVVQQYHQVPL